MRFPKVRGKEYRMHIGGYLAVSLIVWELLYFEVI